MRESIREKQREAGDKIKFKETKEKRKRQKRMKTDKCENNS